MVSARRHCPASASRVCRHSIRALKLTVLLRSSNGYKEPPQKKACTKLKQQWRRPWGSPLAPLPLEFVNWQSLHQGGLSEPINSKFCDARQGAQRFEDLPFTIRTLECYSIGATCPLLSTWKRWTCRDIKTGLAPVGSPPQYLMPATGTARVSSTFSTRDTVQKCKHHSNANTTTIELCHVTPQGWWLRCLSSNHP